MKRALLFGIDNYPFAPLRGCVADALKMQEVLSVNDIPPTGNFQCEVFTSDQEEITTELMYEKIQQYLDDDTGAIRTALLYFAGHGYVDGLDGYLVSQNASKYAQGVEMSDLLHICSQSRIPEIIIVLDCCYSGEFGSIIGNKRLSQLPSGVSILTSSGAEQRSLEENGAGLFTSLLYDALKGEAADILGNIDVAAVYNYVDNMLGAFEQRPIFKTNVSRMTRLRKTTPRITIEELSRITEFFTSPTEPHQLDPSYEDTEPCSTEENVQIFKLLQKMTSVGLVHPVEEKFMYYAAINSKTCVLTPTGKSYWKLIDKGHLRYQE
ncbi:MAG TPA: peptidase C14 [Cryomorphaceae bacterium]|nr:peptidase C14 [Owenweeksia sp.]MBF97745.1 peptidase C14 [Owenweeksia sp.]HAD96319.1 peptidase C14 [Cryomorphaceae bacterium]HBF21839.1 peptidase C14 [Cryomorphaceae bacterium]HCQ16859.1 peptidase C14 [Cryomorphaceae bacterium]|tara:strand:+ start:1165 stop:2133 length:969 start_codon:yes stop_codon:yes gene_type:complete